jgi:hypothetical protein
MTSLADYNNNPGNLRPPKGMTYEGQIGVDENGFAIFENKSFGRNALVRDIEIKQKRGLNNPNDFLDVYAPRSKENPEEGRQNYKTGLAGHLGLNSPKDPFPENSVDKIADYISSFESGQPIQEEKKNDNIPESFTRTSVAEEIKNEPETTTTPTTPEKSPLVDLAAKTGSYLTNKAIENPIATATGLGGAALGAMTSGLGSKNLFEMEKGVKDAKTAYETAKKAASLAATAPAEIGQKLEIEAKRLEQQYLASKASQNALERELANATAESSRYTQPEPDARGKVAGESGTKAYARKMPGQLPPEAMLAEVEDMTSGKNARGKGAYDIAERNAANIQKQKEMGLGGMKMTGRGSEQFVLPNEINAQREAHMASAKERVNQLTPQAKLAAEQAEQARQASTTAEAVRQREVAAAQTAASKAQQTMGTAQTTLETASKNAPQNIGKLGALWSKIPGANMLAGAGAGLSAAEALSRYEKGDKSGAVISTLQLLFDGMAMLPPGTPITAALKGVGVAGGLATTAYDLYRTYNMEQPPPPPPPKKARGGLSMLR